MSTHLETLLIDLGIHIVVLVGTPAHRPARVGSTVLIFILAFVCTSTSYSHVTTKICIDPREVPVTHVCD